jgi:hypothetical protein
MSSKVFYRANREFLLYFRSEDVNSQEVKISQERFLLTDEGVSKETEPYRYG